MPEIITEAVDLRVPDGEMTTFDFKPQGNGKRPAVIVIQEVFGVNANIKSIAERFANEGYVATAPDMFHRTARHVTIEYGNMEAVAAHRAKITDEGLVADLDAVVAHLRSLPEVDGDHIGIVGFCFGGRVSYLAAARVSGISAAAVYYGGGIIPRPGSPEGTPNLLDEAASLSVPVIGFFGETDQGIPVEHVKEIEATLKGLGKEAEMHVYPGAGHGFFCDDRQSYHEEAAKDAWPLTLAFFGRHLKEASLSAG